MSESSIRSEVLGVIERESSHTKNEKRKDQSIVNPQEPRKYWEVTAHCETQLFQQLRPEISFNIPATKYHHQRLTTSGAPNQETVKKVTQAHFHVLRRLNQSRLQVRNFLLPVQLMKMKSMDPFSRQRVIEELCKYFSFQRGLRTVVLEQAELKFQDLCRLLVVIAENTNVKSLFLWHVLDSCEKPFKGPLQSEIVLDDLPRIPYTYIPGGRKYLKDLKTSKGHQQQSSFMSSHESLVSGRILKTKPSLEDSQKIKEVAETDSKNLLSQIVKLESMVKKCLTDSTEDMTSKILKKEFFNLAKLEKEEHVFSQAEVGIQCTLSQDFEETNTSGDAAHIYHIYAVDSKLQMPNEIEFRALKNTRLRFCDKYLKYYENTKIDIDVLRDIYMMTLDTLSHLTQLAVNYCMLADGTGNALLSIGSIMSGKLKHLNILCEPEDMPSSTHQWYDDDALQSIPDIIWHDVQRRCPGLKLHIVCVSMSAYEVTKRFVTKSMPLSSFYMENGFCPTLASPDLTIFCSFKCLWLDHADTLETVDLTLWYVTGRIDSSLEILIQKTNLHSFAYRGPLQFRITINKLCDAALESSNLKYFKLMIQGDPCYPNNAREISSHLYNIYKLKFQDKSIHFELETFSS